MRNIISIFDGHHYAKYFDTRAFAFRAIHNNRLDNELNIYGDSDHSFISTLAVESDHEQDVVALAGQISEVLKTGAGFASVLLEISKENCNNNLVVQYFIDCIKMEILKLRISTNVNTTIVISGLENLKPGAFRKIVRVLRNCLEFEVPDSYDDAYPPILIVATPQVAKKISIPIHNTIHVTRKKD